MEHATEGEARVARRIIEGAIAREWTVSVNDGDAWPIKRSRDAAAILAAMCTTGEDVLVFRDASGERVGFFHLIYGNDDDGAELIADCSIGLDDFYSEICGDHAGQGE